MANYTYNENELVLLNDKAITYVLSASKSTKYGVPTIPSQTLFKETYDKLSADDKSISDFIEDVISADLYQLSGEVNRLCTELSDNVESKFVHKAGDSISWLSAANGLSTTSFRANTSGKAIPTDQFTDVVVDENGFKVDAIGEGRQIVLSTNNSTNDIIVNGSSLSDHIKSEVRISADEAIRLAKAYADAEIQKLDVDDTPVTKQFVTAVSEADGKIVVQRAALVSTDIPTISETQVSGLTEDLQNLSANYVKVSDFKTTKIDNDGKLLSAEDFDLTYDSTSHDITLKAGEKTYKFSAIEFIKSKTVDHMSIETDSEGNKWLLIYWTADDFIKLNINELVQVYNFENGISSQILPTGGIHVGATADLARTTYANAISSYANAISTSLQTEVGRAFGSESTLLGMIEAEESRAEGIEESLQSQINSVSTDLTAEVEARKNADGKITTDVNAISSDVISLKAYATELSGSGPDNIGTIATLSNSITTLQSDIIKELKFVNHIRIGNDTPVTTIAAFFEDQKLAVKDGNKVTNGSIYDVQFVDGSEYSSSAKYVVEDLSLGLGDCLIVHDHNNNAFVSIADLHATGTSKNLYVLKAGTSRYEFENAYSWLLGETNRLCSEISDDVVAKYSWLSGETNRLCSEISAAVSLSTSALCSELCACELSVADLSTTVDKLCTEISNDLTSKCNWLSNNVVTVSNDNSTQHQLSVIKINKDEYEQIVADDETQLYNNTLYVLDSDYIDAYGQVLCNLVMADDSVPSDAANKHYVDEKDSKLATSINAVSSSVEMIKSKFNADTIVTDPVLSTLLEDHNDSDISTVISAVMYIFNKLAQV